MELQQRKSQPNFPPRHSRVTKREAEQKKKKKRGQGNKRFPETIISFKNGMASYIMHHFEDLK